MNILFDKVQIKEATQYTGGGGGGGHKGVLATSASVFQLVGHYGGPRYILRIDPVAGI